MMTITSILRLREYRFAERQIHAEVAYSLTVSAAYAEPHREITGHLADSVHGSQRSFT